MTRRAVGGLVALSLPAVATTRRAIGGLVALSLPAVVVLAACGTSELTPTQIRGQATRICTLAAQRTAAIALPERPSGGQRFLGLGIAVLAAEVRDLRAFGQNAPLGTAVTAMAGELAALRSSLKGLRTGNDPVVAIKTLQQELEPLERRAIAAWRTLRVPACVSR